MESAAARSSRTVNIVNIVGDMEFVGIHFGNSVRILPVVIHLGKLKKRILQREVAPYSAVCVPVRPVQHAPF
jgi:hypothetical protein